MLNYNVKGFREKKFGTRQNNDMDAWILNYREFLTVVRYRQNYLFVLAPYDPQGNRAIQNLLFLL